MYDYQIAREFEKKYGCSEKCYSMFYYLNEQGLDDFLKFLGMEIEEKELVKYYKRLSKYIYYSMPTKRRAGEWIMQDLFFYLRNWEDLYNDYVTVIVSFINKKYVSEVENKDIVIKMIQYDPRYILNANPEFINEELFITTMIKKPDMLYYWMIREIELDTFTAPNPDFHSMDYDNIEAYYADCNSFKKEYTPDFSSKIYDYIHNESILNRIRKASKKFDSIIIELEEERKRIIEELERKKEWQVYFDSLLTWDKLNKFSDEEIIEIIENGEFKYEYFPLIYCKEKYELSDDYYINIQDFCLMYKRFGILNILISKHPEKFKEIKEEVRFMKKYSPIKDIDESVKVAIEVLEQKEFKSKVIEWLPFKNQEFYKKLFLYNPEFLCEYQGAFYDPDAYPQMDCESIISQDFVKDLISINPVFLEYFRDFCFTEYWVFLKEYKLSEEQERIITDYYNELYKKDKSQVSIDSTKDLEEDDVLPFDEIPVDDKISQEKDIAESKSELELIEENWLKLLSR